MRHCPFRHLGFLCKRCFHLCTIISLKRTNTDKRDEDFVVDDSSDDSGDEWEADYSESSSEEDNSPLNVVTAADTNM